MRATVFKLATIGVFAACAATTAQAQQSSTGGSSTSAAPAAGPAADIGKRDFETYCAVCHNKDGKGGGPFSMLLTTKVPDLTVLAKNNAGVFPFNRAYEVVYGIANVPGHGTREMPIWGDVYKEKAPNELGPYYQPSDSASYVRGRILALIGYISTLQEK